MLPLAVHRLSPVLTALLLLAAPDLGAEPASFNDVMAQPAPRPDHIWQWGSHPDQRIEQYEPENTSSRHAVLIHGGCWLNQYTMHYMRPMAAAMADAGWTVWSLGYRRLGDGEDAGALGLNDLITGLETVGRLVDDSAQPWLIGHSAGGHMALLVAGEQGPEQVAGAVGLAAITDPRTYAEQDGSCNQAAARLLADSRDADALQPARHLPLGMPVLLLQGELDPIVPMSQAEGFARQAQGEGDTVRVIPLAEAGHFDLVMADSQAFETLMDQLESAARSR